MSTTMSLPETIHYPTSQTNTVDLLNYLLKTREEALRAIETLDNCLRQKRITLSEARTMLRRLTVAMCAAQEAESIVRGVERPKQERPLI